MLSRCFVQAFEHENLHKAFRTRYGLFSAESESSNLDAREHALAMREELQEIVDRFRDRDRPCHICVFGLMGHGKSRFINMMLTALTKEPSALGGGSAGSNRTIIHEYAAQVALIQLHIVIYTVTDTNANVDVDVDTHLHLHTYIHIHFQR